MYFMYHLYELLPEVSNAVLSLRWNQDYWTPRPFVKMGESVSSRSSVELLTFTTPQRILLRWKIKSDLRVEFLAFTMVWIRIK